MRSNINTAVPLFLISKSSTESRFTHPQCLRYIYVEKRRFDIEFKDDRFVSTRNLDILSRTLRKAVTLDIAVNLRKEHTLFNFFFRWCRGVEECLAEEIAQGAKARRLVAACLVVRRWRLIALAAPLGSWKSIIGESIRLKSAAKNVVRRWSRWTLARSFRSWRNNAKETMSMKFKSARIVHRLRNKCHVKCFEAWSEQTDKEKEMKRLKPLKLKFADNN